MKIVVPYCEKTLLYLGIVVNLFSVNLHVFYI